MTPRFTAHGMPWRTCSKRLKVFRRLASRFEKTKRMFFAFICCALAAIYTADNLW